MKMTERNNNGQFAQGNSGGPGRPRRPIEREYLQSLNAAVPLQVWQAICKRAADDAMAGDAKAREWLAKWLLGMDARPLTTLAAEELNVEPARAADREIELRKRSIEAIRAAATQAEIVEMALRPLD